MKKVSIMGRVTGKRNRNIKAGIITALLAVTIIFTGMSFSSYSDEVNHGLSDSLVRFHVIANSDSDEDQQLKRDVRDVVIEYMKDKLDTSKGIELTKEIITEHMTEIEKIAKNEVVRQGKDYPVKAMLGKFPFPTKVYGDVALPAGNYQALRVVIGDGGGANWWCVLFPPLCFVDATHGTVPDSVKEDLENVLSKDQYELITASEEQEDIPVKIRFKVVEVFQATKIKFSGAVNKIFNW